MPDPVVVIRVAVIVVWPQDEKFTFPKAWTSDLVGSCLFTSRVYSFRSLPACRRHSDLGKWLCSSFLKEKKGGRKKQKVLGPE